MTPKTDEKITREKARALMPAVDEATKAVLAAMGFEAVRFDATVCPEEGWMKMTVRIRPVGRASA